MIIIKLSWSILQFMIEQGGLTFRAIQDVAATTIQSCWRGYRVRKPFQKRKTLYMRHEQLKRDMKRRSSAVKEEELKAQITQSATSSCHLALEYQEPRPSTDSGRRQALCHRTSSADGLFQLDLELLSEPSNMYYNSNANISNDEDDDDDGSYRVVNEEYYDYESDLEESYLLPTILETSNPREMMLSNRECTMIPEDEMEGKTFEQINIDEKAIHTQDAKNEPEDIKASIYEMLSKQTENSSSNFNRSDDKPQKYAANMESSEASNDIESNDTLFMHEKPKQDHLKDAFAKDEMKIVLHPKTSEIARKQRERRQLIRAKVNAATTIQRWYRRHRRVKQSEVNFYELQIDQQDLVKNIAALTIQLFWRKYLSRKYQRDSSLSSGQPQLTELPKHTAPSTKPAKPKKKESSARAMDETGARLSRNGLRALSASIGNRRRTAPLGSPLNVRKDTHTSSLTRRGTNNKVRPISVPRMTKSASGQTYGPGTSSRTRRTKNAWKN